MLAQSSSSEIDSARFDGDAGSDSPRSGGWISWIGLLLVLLLSIPCLLPTLGRPPVVHPAEREALAISTESYTRSVEDAPQWLAPTLDGQKQLDKAPGVTWLHLLMWHRLEAVFGSLEDEWRIYGARLVSVLMTLLAVAAVYWIGHSIGGSLTALLAGLIYMANPLVIQQGRMATMDSAFVGLYLLSVAAALWAIRPLRPSPSVERQFIGWTLCGLAMGAAQLVWGSAALAYIVPGVLVILVICPGRIGHLLGLLAALIIGVLMALPWAVYVFDQGGNPWVSWAQRFGGPGGDQVSHLLAQLGRQFLWILIFLLPWTWWLLLAMVQPWSSSSRGSRLRLLIGWAFLMVNVVMLPAMPGSRELRDLLPIMAGASVVLASLFGLYSELATIGLYPRSWRWGRWPFLTILILLSILIPLWLALQDALIEWGFEQWVAGMAVPWYLSVPLGLVLLGLAGISVRWTWRDYPFHAATTWGLWCVVASGSIAIAVTAGGSARAVG
ncbi:MAG: glycosyltransferase family 39 protein [Phycisphaeraceae bacterium]|nr:glycosyltransferase family 39 protein [Phycisphaeraceae bacterium]